MDFCLLLKGASGSHVIDVVSFRVFTKKKATNLHETNKEKTDTWIYNFEITFYKML